MNTSLIMTLVGITIVVYAYTRENEDGYIRYAQISIGISIIILGFLPQTVEKISYQDVKSRVDYLINDSR
jgi:hypothetical protein